MYILELQVLDSLLQQYEKIFVSGVDIVQGYAVGTLWLLIGIDFILSVLLNLQDGDHMKNLISKIFKYGFWVWLVTNYSEFVNVIINSLVKVGTEVGGSGMGTSLLHHPSAICEQGLKLTTPFFKWLDSQTGLEVIFSNFWISLVVLVSILAIWLAFAILAIQICITYIEFYLSATLLFIFIPFGANKYLSFLAEKAIGAIFSFGVKLMVLATIVGISGPIINTWADKITFEGNPEHGILLATVTACWIITLLAWQAPALAAGMMTGSPSLSASTVTSAGITGAVGGGMAVAGAAKTAVGAAKMASNAGGGITSATAAAAYAAGGISGADTIGAKAASSMGAGIKESVMKSYKGDNNTKN